MADILVQRQHDAKGLSDLVRKAVSTYFRKEYELTSGEANEFDPFETSLGAISFVTGWLNEKWSFVRFPHVVNSQGVAKTVSTIASEPVLYVKVEDSDLWKYALYLRNKHVDSFQSPLEEESNDADTESPVGGNPEAVAHELGVPEREFKIAQALKSTSDFAENCLEEFLQAIGIEEPYPFSETPEGAVFGRLVNGQ